MPSKPNHKPTGELCSRCGVPSRLHNYKERNRSRYMKGYNKAHPRPNPVERIIGIDGEGQGRQPHLYNFMGAADEGGATWALGDDPKKRLGTAECLDFILDLPTRSLIFGFAFLYDLTKILTDLPDRLLYLLFHEAKRARLVDGRVLYRPVKWQDFQINYMHRRFTVRKGNRQATVWDIFAFFQSKFTKACIDWQIGNKETVEAMEAMKERRSTFDAQSFDQIKSYCAMECLHLAQLGRQLIDAHVDAGFKLATYFGAGSTATSLMKKHGVKEYIGDIPEEMHNPVACAFFGGRFENSVIGPINRPVWNYDINSAYPYAATFLPCLIHGRWRLETRPAALSDKIHQARLALVNWEMKGPYSPNTQTSWGPLPVRKADGTIAFPLLAREGWTWKEEYLAARKLRPDVTAGRAWLYTVDCQCQPFSFLPEVYLERVRLGSDSRGIVLKLGPNSVYGKLVQSVGHNPPFQCWVWGGNITSLCRSQLLDAIRLAPNARNILMLATDGVWSDCPLELPTARDTGTGHVKKKDGSCGTLGGWSHKEFPQGVFAARPGIYFPLEPTEKELEKVRARGLGRKVLYEQWRLVTKAFEYGQASVIVGARHCDVATQEERASTRFIGAKTGLSWTPKQGTKRNVNYGEWIDWPTEINFDPRPKRCGVNADRTLRCWPKFDAPSLPYSKAVQSDETLLLVLAQLIAEEQPNADFVEI